MTIKYFSRKLLFVFFAAVAFLSAENTQAQVTVTARFADTAGGQRSPLKGVNVFLYKGSDTVAAYSAATNAGGLVQIENVQEGNYRIYASYVGYRPYQD